MKRSRAITRSKQEIENMPFDFLGLPPLVWFFLFCVLHSSFTSHYYCFVSLQIQQKVLRLLSPSDHANLAQTVKRFQNKVDMCHKRNFVLNGIPSAGVCFSGTLTLVRTQAAFPFPLLSLLLTFFLLILNNIQLALLPLLLHHLLFR